MITKSVFYFSAIFATALLVVKGVENPGILTIDWFDYYIEVNIMFAIILVLAFIFLVQMMMHILTILGFLPSVIKYRSENKKLKTGLDNLKSIALNLSLGNKKEATKFAKKNQKVIPEYPVFDEMLSLKAKKDLTNDIVDVRLAKEKIEEFLENFDNEKALKVIDNILQQHPTSAWAKVKKYSLLVRLEEFEQALGMLKILKKEKLISKEQLNLENCFLNYELALINNDDIQALKLAETGLKSQANFIKLAELSADILIKTEQQEKALKLLISLAKNYNEALSVFEKFKHITESLEFESQIKWLDKFAKVNPSFAGCQLAKAHSLILQDKQDQAVAFLDTNNKSKETLIALSQIHKSIGDNGQSIKVLELANNLNYTDKKDLIAQYAKWQKQNLALNSEEFNSLDSDKVNEDMLIEND